MTGFCLPHPIVGREAELAVVGDFLADASVGPAVLVVTGAAGIGKTTLWTACVEQARDQGVRVLACRPGAAEVRLSYAGLTDLWEGVDEQVWGPLAAPQREALGVALLRAEQLCEAPDPRAVAVGALSVLEHLAANQPVLVSVDDHQWLDAPTAELLRFVTRRLSARVGVLVAVREPAPAPADLRGRDAPELRRLRLGPLGTSDIRRLVLERTGRSLARPVLSQLEAVAAGNPFYALELSRAAGDTSTAPALPESLAGLVQERLGGLAPEVLRSLLVAASAADPSIEVIGRVLAAGGEVGRGTDALVAAETEGIVVLERGRVRFTHPLLARGVYAAASAQDRRRMHRVLGAVVDGIEERARHLALAALGPEPEVVEALDCAGAAAAARGAPAAGAELLELAIALGADAGERRIAAAGYHCHAGDLERARALVEDTVPDLGPGPTRARALALLGMIHYNAYRLADAAVALEQAVIEAGDEGDVQILVELDMAFVLTNLGRIPDALPFARAAADHAAECGDDGSLAQALAALVMAGFVSGQGIDETRLVLALELEDPGRRGRIHNQPTTIAGLCFLFAGRHDEARRALSAVRQGCLERGEESDVPLLTFWMVLLECWAGNVAAAQAAANDVLERATMLASPVQQAMGLAAQAAVAALAGRADDTRRFATESLAMFEAAGLKSWAMWPLAALCALDVAAGQYGTVAATAGPVAVMVLESMGLAEPTVVPLIPDVAEALIAEGRLEDAEPLVAVLEERGRVLDRPWAIGVGARGRALLASAQGRPGAAMEAIERSLEAFDRVAHPLDRARTLLVKGQLHRRAREKLLARRYLEEALAGFETIGSQLWVARARDELGRVNIRPAAPSGLTATEQRVAELAAQGLTNRQIAAAAFVTPKTVEANLVRVYRKLGITSRAELGSRMAARQADGAGSAHP